MQRRLDSSGFKMKNGMHYYILKEIYSLYWQNVAKGGVLADRKLVPRRRLFYSFIYLFFTFGHVSRSRINKSNCDKRPDMLHRRHKSIRSPAGVPSISQLPVKCQSHRGAVATSKPTSSPWVSDAAAASCRLDRLGSIGTGRALRTASHMWRTADPQQMRRGVQETVLPFITTMAK